MRRIISALRKADRWIDKNFTWFWMICSGIAVILMVSFVVFAPSNRR